MKVDFTFKHIDSSEALMEYARDRIDKITKFELKPMDVSFVISMLRHECTIDVTVTEARRKFKANATSDDFYRSVEMVVNKLLRQMSKDKRRIKGHKNPEIAITGKISKINEWLEHDHNGFVNRPVKKAG
jgi:putative sigma-54 modulation protein